MAGQRSALGVGGVSALPLHHADGALLASLPGVAGVLGAFGLLAVVEARYVHSSSHGAAANSPTGPATVRAAASGVVLLCVAAPLVLATAR